MSDRSLDDDLYDDADREGEELREQADLQAERESEDSAEESEDTVVDRTPLDEGDEGEDIVADRAEMLEQAPIANSPDLQGLELSDMGTTARRTEPLGDVDEVPDAPADRGVDRRPRRGGSGRERPVKKPRAKKPGRK